MIISREHLHQQLLPHRNRNERIVFTNGCFDLLHIGHITYLRLARLLGDCLIVGLNSDDSVRRLKGPTRPILPQDERALLLDALRFVDYVVLFEEDTPECLIREIQPNILVKGGDYRPEQIAGARCVAENGGSIVILPYISNRSTTQIIEKICQTVCLSKKSVDL